MSDADIENRLLDMGGKERVGWKWASNMEIYTHYVVKWMLLNLASVTSDSV